MVASLRLATCIFQTHFFVVDTKKMNSLSSVTSIFRTGCAVRARGEQHSPRHFCTCPNADLALHMYVSTISDKSTVVNCGKRVMTLNTVSLSVVTGTI